MVTYKIAAVFALVLIVGLFTFAFFNNAAEKIVDGKCGIEQCHGLDLSCGSDIPDMCTAEYRLGDFCRQYVTCEIKEQYCVKVEDDLFSQCRSCIKACDQQNQQEAFDCESLCRQQLTN